MENNNIHKDLENYVVAMFKKVDDKSLIFHNLDHTRNVVNRTLEIAGHYNLTERDVMVLNVSAWFHDTGHLYTDPAHHEEKSVELMREFMTGYDEDPELINDIEACIIATRAPRNPVDLLQQIICDADTYHLGTKEFKNTNNQVREEMATKSGHAIDQLDWNKETLVMLEKHQFYTTYCKDLLSEKKRGNMKKLKKKDKELEEWNDIEKEISRKKEKELNESTIGPEIKERSGLQIKGIQTMLRLTSENHLKLSDMADRKASILISVNSIIISVILTVLLRRLQVDTYLTIPTIMFLLFSLTTIVTAILATRPKVSEGNFSEQDIADKKTNLLFFGNYYKVSFQDYERAMRIMMREPDYLYGTLIKDIYMLGVVLGRKYKLIRLAYNIFMIGIILSVLAFAIAVFFFSNGDATISSSSANPF